MKNRIKMNKPNNRNNIRGRRKLKTRTIIDIPREMGYVASLCKTRSYKKEQSENKHKHLKIKNNSRKNFNPVRVVEDTFEESQKVGKKVKNGRGKPRKLDNWVRIPNSKITEATEGENRENERKKLLNK